MLCLNLDLLLFDNLFSVKLSLDYSTEKMNFKFSLVI